MKTHPVMEEGRTGQRAENMLAREVAKWANALRRCDAVRKSHPHQVLDVIHRDFHRDPMAVLERIYDFIGMRITDEVRTGFAQRIADKPEMSHGVHRYDIAEFGMTEHQAREPFGDYLERFALLRE